jgi:hypothetical protein
LKALAVLSISTVVAPPHLKSAEASNARARVGLQKLTYFVLLSQK